MSLDFIELLAIHDVLQGTSLHIQCTVYLKYNKVFFFNIDTSLVILVTVTFSNVNQECLNKSSLFQLYLLVTGSDYI